MARPATVLQEWLHILNEINFSLDGWRQIIRERNDFLAEDYASDGGNQRADQETSPA
jgi:hypothetical protein